MARTGDHGAARAPRRRPLHGGPAHLAPGASPEASWGYLRFHEGRASPRPCYGDRALETWAGRLADRFSPDETVYAFFNNDPEGCAARDARRFARKLERAGLSPTNVPEAFETPVGEEARR